MTKKERKKPTCKKCGKEFDSGGEVRNHYKQFPDHRPVKAEKTAKVAKGFSPTQHIELAIGLINGQIAEKRQMLSNIEQLKKEITELENQANALKRMLPPI